ncbi:MAG: DUF2779 domain-containing protein [Dehalococcoidales bacterium]
MPKKLLSKSKYLSGLQCLKYLWLLYNDPGKIPEFDDSTLRIFEQGHQVGELARKLFPDGIDISSADFNGNLKLTKKLLPSRKPLFEPGFYQDNLFSRLDILNPAGDDTWDIVEVKSSTSVKDVNLHDVSFQRLCCEKAGLKINRCFVAVVNNKYVRQGEISPAEYFTIHDITDKVDRIAEGIEERIEEMFKVISAPTCPEIRIGEYCTSPYDCPVTLCRENLGIFDLYRGGKKCYQMYYDGILKVEDIPSDYKLSEPQQIQQACAISGTPHIDKKAVREFLKKIKSPVYYLDFETISPVIPLFDGTRPYQRIPFQYSLHKVTGKETEHYSFLAKGRDDPRPALLKQLKKDIGTKGSILTYNQSFEEGVIEEMAGVFPEYTGWAAVVCSRMLDLLQPFQSFSYYHPLQHGSASIKKVLPAVTGKGYNDLAIAEGEAASSAFLAVTFGEASEAERLQVRQDLEKYCGLDTEGMIWIVDELKKVSGQTKQIGVQGRLDGL